MTENTPILVFRLQAIILLLRDIAIYVYMLFFGYFDSRSLNVVVFSFFMYLDQAIEYKEEW